MEQNYSKEINELIKKGLYTKYKKLPFATSKNHYGNEPRSWQYPWNVIKTNGIARFYDTYLTTKGRVRRVKYVLDYQDYYDNELYKNIINKVIKYCNKNNISYSEGYNTIVIRYILNSWKTI